MFTKIKIAAGLVLILVSFIYILRRPGVSMMESLMNHRQEQMERQQRQQEEEAQMVVTLEEENQSQGRSA